MRARGGGFGGSDLDIVFPTIFGHPRDPNATARDWRSVRTRLGFPEVKFHSFRKSVATIIDHNGGSARDAAEYLGHADPAMTQRVYTSRKVGGLKAASAVENVSEHLPAGRRSTGVVGPC